MNLDDSQPYFATDTMSVSFEQNDGVTTDDDSLTVDWSQQAVVSDDEVPDYYESFFDTDSYYVLDATVAKPIKQTYVIKDEKYTFKKPSDELQKSAATLDNRPWTLGHPSSGAVASVDDIHGFWREPRWVEDSDDLDASLYFPTNDGEARNYVSQNDDVSVGFRNWLDKADEPDVDAYQRGIVYDHVASVDVGRCSGEDGCGLATDSSSLNTMMPAEDVSPRVMGHDGMASDGETQGNCDCEYNTFDNTMTCDCGGNGTFDMNWTDRSTESLRTDHDGLDSALTQKEKRINELESTVESYDSVDGKLPEGYDVTDAAEAVSELQSVLELDEDSTIVDGVETLHESAQTLQDRVEEYESERREELVEFIDEHSDLEIDEDDTVDDLAEKKEIIESVTDTDGSETTTKNANPTTDGEESTTSLDGGVTGINPNEFMEDN